MLVMMKQKNKKNLNNKKIQLKEKLKIINKIEIIILKIR